MPLGCSAEHILLKRRKGINLLLGRAPLWTASETSDSAAVAAGIMVLHPVFLRPDMHVCSVRARLLCLWDSPGRNTGVGCYALLKGIFLTQGSNPVSSVSCIGRVILYH